MKRVVRSTVALAAALFACGGPPSPVIGGATALPTAPQEEDFRSHPPPAGPEADFTPFPVEESKLANGLRVLVVRGGGTLTSMQLVFRGTAHFPNERPGVLAVMLRSLFGGSPTYDGHALRRVFEANIAEFSSTIDQDYAALDVTGGVDRIAPCIDVIADLVQHASFTQDTVDFHRLPIVEQAKSVKDNPATLADLALRRVLYGPTHPYVRPWWTLDGSPQIDRTEVERVAHAVLDPGDATLILAGKIDEAVVTSAKRAFGTWQATPHAAPAAPPPALPKPGPRLVVIHRPGSTQAQIILGTIGPARSTFEWPALLAIHELLGARPTSRLGSALRAKEPVTWGGHSNLWNARGDTLFSWSSTVPVERTAAVLAEIERAANELREREVPAEELEGAKTMFLRGIPSWFETSRSTAHTYDVIPVFGMSRDAVSALRAQVRAVDAAAVRELAKKILIPDRVRAVIVADWSTLKGSFASSSWGPIELRDTSGNPITSSEIK